jgi:hypothetical protein
MKKRLEYNTTKLKKTIRLSKLVNDYLKILSDDYNITESLVITKLIEYGYLHKKDIF